MYNICTTHTKLTILEGVQASIEPRSCFTCLNLKMPSNWHAVFMSILCFGLLFGFSNIRPSNGHDNGTENILYRLKSHVHLFDILSDIWRNTLVFWNFVVPVRFFFGFYKWHIFDILHFRLNEIIRWIESNLPCIFLSTWEIWVLGVYLFYCRDWDALETREGVRKGM